MTSLPPDGSVFDAAADRYARWRPTYPDALVDHACEYAGLGPGDPVLEIGPGTGQLTASLLARGLRVTAVEPGPALAARTRALADAPALGVMCERFEDAALGSGAFRAVFSAAAIHWVDPDVGWAKLADALAPGGTLALLSFFGLDHPDSRPDQRDLLTALARIAPAAAARWPRYLEETTLRAEAGDRAANISALWSWLGDYDLTREVAAARFGPAELTALPRAHEHSASEVIALLATMSFWSGLDTGQREALTAAITAWAAAARRPVRSHTVACLALARRLADPERARLRR